MKIKGSTTHVEYGVYKIGDQQFICDPQLNIGVTRKLILFSKAKVKVEAWIRESDIVLLGVKVNGNY